jgi:hypothetical protein
MKSMFIGIDFDGTMVTHKYPELGEPLDYAVEVVHKLMKAGHKIILYTMRSDTEKGNRLQEAVDYMEGEGIVLYGVNENKTQKHWTDSPKIFCNLYIDDAALGIPATVAASGRLMVDWIEVEELLEERGYL